MLGIFVLWGRWKIPDSYLHGNWEVFKNSLVLKWAVLKGLYLAFLVLRQKSWQWLELPRHRWRMQIYSEVALEYSGGTKTFRFRFCFGFMYLPHWTIYNGLETNHTLKVVSFLFRFCFNRKLKRNWVTRLIFLWIRLDSLVNWHGKRRTYQCNS